MSNYGCIDPYDSTDVHRSVEQHRLVRRWRRTLHLTTRTEDAHPMQVQSLALPLLLLPLLLLPLLIIHLPHSRPALSCHKVQSFSLSPVFSYNLFSPLMYTPSSTSLNVDAERLCVSALCNLSARVEIQDHLASLGGVTVLVSMLESSDHGTAEQVHSFSFHIFSICLLWPLLLL